MPGLGGAGERVGIDQRAGIVLAAVDAVGVAGERVDAVHAVERDGERQQELGVAAAFAFALERDRGLAARDQHARRLLGLAAQFALPRDAGMDQRHVARLAFDGVAEDHRRHARLARDLGGGFERGLRRRDHDVLDAREPLVAGLRRLLGLAQALEHARRHVDLVFLDDAERVLVGGRIGRRSGPRR